MAVITKKDEKIAATVEQLEGSRSPDDFVAKFKELYPKDWARIEKSYRDHERKTKPGKSHPMPEPDQYLKNALSVWLKSHE
ncbi:MAG: hypothetical protein H6999_10150 [Hahellaceae bacterium]|jgi:hypothetical protein|uniref:hypothetical protein n=1 Tax=unclassified Halomonas TaxID=2609666 RepID=UPI000E8ECE2F|nr:MULTISPECIES: hypothetical protein [unclassified Halomonas]MCO7244605.1 hypothetical protein [Halomonas sp. Ps84H-12]MCP5170106.1 hypothetical protein [Hahellaceae bacterium]HBQ06415.1 hypothetical protein [Halomonas sp.]|tara:strand:+ start:502 stop:744 length:243 start_codon:yes stop_codon:yes gene_type:complete